MHLLASVTIQPNLELKTRPKQLLGSLPLVITLPGGFDNIFFNAVYECRIKFKSYVKICLQHDSTKAENKNV